MHSLLLVVLALNLLGVDGFFAGMHGRFVCRSLTLGARGKGNSKRGGSDKDLLLQQMLFQLNEIRNITDVISARADANSARADANSARTDAILKDLQNTTAVNSARTDAKLKQLIDYNQNRDDELETWRAQATTRSTNRSSTS